MIHPYNGIFSAIKRNEGTSLVAQWLRHCTPNAGGPGLIPGQGTRSHVHDATKSLHATTKEPTCRNQGACLPQLRPSATK